MYEATVQRLNKGGSETTKRIPNNHFPITSRCHIDHDLCDFRWHHPDRHRSISVHISLRITLYILYPDCFSKCESCFIGIEYELYPLFYELFMDSRRCFYPTIIVLDDSYRRSLYLERVFCLKNKRIQCGYKAINSNSKFFALLGLICYFLYDKWQYFFLF